MMSIGKKQRSYLLVFAVAACFLLNVDILGPYGLYARRGLGGSRVYGEILPDGTLFIPLGDTNGRSKGQNLQERVKDTRKDMCVDLLADRDEKKLTRLHVQSDLCGDLSLGNMISTLLSYNLAAHLSGIPFTFSCVDSVPGIMSTMQKVEEAPFLPSDYSEDYNLEKFCQEKSGRFQDMAYGHYLSADAMRNQDMAYGHYLVANIMRNQIATGQSLVTEGDDAVIHVRLHDAFQSIKRPSQRGLFQHVAYASMLKKAEQEKGEIRTISIVTQTFVEEKLERDNDRKFAKVSEIVARDLARYLRLEFPNAVVNIHNDWFRETTITSYARLIRAKKIAICGCSTFCPLPVVSVQEDVLAYLYDSKYLNAFYTKYLAENRDNIHLWKAPMLGSNDMGDLTDQQILDFLQNEDTTGIEI